MMRWDYFRKGVICAVLLSFMGISTACYGPFNLTKNIHHWNGGIRGSGRNGSVHDVDSNLPDRRGSTARTVPGPVCRG